VLQSNSCSCVSLYTFVTARAPLHLITEKSATSLGLSTTRRSSLQSSTSAGHHQQLSNNLKMHWCVCLRRRSLASASYLGFVEGCLPRGRLSRVFTSEVCLGVLFGAVCGGSADIQSPQHLDPVVPATSNPGSRTRPQPAIDHYGTASTFHDDNICETRFSMLCTSSLELTTKNCSQ